MGNNCSSSEKRSNSLESKHPNAFRIGILGTAKTAKNGIIKPSNKLRGSVIYGVASRNRHGAKKFAEKYNIYKVYHSYDALIESEEIDIVYIPLSNEYHAYYTIKALQHGKHVLCEKPLASNENEVIEIRKAYDEARKNTRTNTKPLIVEAFHFRFHPFVLKLRDMVRNRELGEIKRIESEFVLPWYQFIKKNIRYSRNDTQPDLAGGSVMDMGCCAISAMRIFAETSMNEEFPEYQVVKAKIKDAFNHVSGIDEKAFADITVRSRIFGTTKPLEAKISSSSRGCNFRSTLKVKVSGSRENLQVSNILDPTRFHKIRLHNPKTGERRSLNVEMDRNLTPYDYQLRCFLDALKGDLKALELCYFAGNIKSSQQNMRIIDAIYTKAGASPRRGIRNS